MKIASFDIETYSKNNYFLCGSVCSDRGIEFFEKRSEMMEYILSLRGYSIFATNLEFDFFALFGNTDIEKEFVLNFRDSRLISVIYKDSIKFMDSYNIAPMSVKALGKIVGIEKIKTPNVLTQNLEYKPKITEEIKKYNMNDSLITYKFISEFFNEISRFKVSVKPTLASISKDIFYKNFLNKRLLQRDVNYNDLILQSYAGGRNEVIQRGYFEDLYYYDFNSLYPSVMRDIEYPIPNSCYFTSNGSLNIIRNYEGISEIEFEIENKHIPLMFYKTNKLIFPCGKIRGIYTHLEIRELMENGFKPKVFRQLYYTKSDYIFKDFVEYFYKKRLEFKKQNDKREFIYKIILNSLYGKFAQRLEKEKIMNISNLSIEEIENLKNNEEVRIVGNYAFIKEESKKIPDFYIPIFSSYTTAAGRIKLYNSISNIEDSVIYYDTDSIITDKKLSTSDSLGCLKKEYDIDRAIFVKPKFYCIEDKNGKFISKVKGLPHSFESFEDFESFLNNPVYKYKRFLKFRTAIRKGNVYNQIYEVLKEFDLNDDKRVWKNKSINIKDSEISKPILI